MKKLSFLAAVALVALGTSAATAQDTTRKEATGEVAKPITFASVVMALDNSNATATALAAFKPADASKIEIVDVKTQVMNPADDSTLKAAVERNKDAIAKVRDELKKNEIVVAAVSGSESKPEPGDIVGAEIQPGDRLVVFVWKK